MAVLFAYHLTPRIKSHGEPSSAYRIFRPKNLWFATNWDRHGRVRSNINFTSTCPKCKTERDILIPLSKKLMKFTLKFEDLVRKDVGVGLIKPDIHPADYGRLIYYPENLLNFYAAQHQKYLGKPPELPPDQIAAIKLITRYGKINEKASMPKPL